MMRYSGCWLGFVGEWALRDELQRTDSCAAGFVDLQEVIRMKM